MILSFVRLVSSLVEVSIIMTQKEFEVGLKTPIYTDNGPDLS